MPEGAEINYTASTLFLEGSYHALRPTADKIYTSLDEAPRYLRPLLYNAFNPLFDALQSAPEYFVGFSPSNDSLDSRVMSYESWGQVGNGCVETSGTTLLKFYGNPTFVGDLLAQLFPFGGSFSSTMELRRRGYNALGGTLSFEDYRRFISRGYFLGLESNGHSSVGTGYIGNKVATTNYDYYSRHTTTFKDSDFIFDPTSFGTISPKFGFESVRQRTEKYSLAREIRIPTGISLYRLFIDIPDSYYGLTLATKFRMGIWHSISLLHVTYDASLKSNNLAVGVSSYNKFLVGEAEFSLDFERHVGHFLYYGPFQYETRAGVEYGRVKAMVGYDTNFYGYIGYRSHVVNASVKAVKLKDYYAVFASLEFI